MSRPLSVRVTTPQYFVMSTVVCHTALLRYFPVNPTYPSDIVSSRLSSQLVFPTRPVNLLNSVRVLVLIEFTYEKCAFFG